MSDTRIFTLGENATGGNNLLAMLPALLQRQGVDPNLVALCQGRGQNGWGGDGIFGILLLFILMGAFNGGGFGGFGGNRGWGGNGQSGVVPILNNDANTAVIMQAVQRNGFDISSLATALNTSSDAVMAAINALGGQICNLGTQMGQNTNQIMTAVMQGDNGIISQICSCCCDLKQLISQFGAENRLAICEQTNALQNSINFVNASVERGFASTNFETQRQTCDITKAIADSTAQILAGQKAAEFREIQREVNQLRDERTQYQMSALLQQQSQNLINTIRPCPIPSYPVCNPWGCNGQFVGNGYPYAGCGNNGCNNGCGC